jgi:C4-dicarboxylate-specific signal transduction histidine kinase
MVRIQIVDNGPGVKPEILPHLFEPFVTSKGVGEGTGLGLALAYATVGQLGGTMDAENLAVGGFEVRLSLPILVKNA